jgi:hypothetical protein
LRGRWAFTDWRGLLMNMRKVDLVYEFFRIQVCGLGYRF